MADGTIQEVEVPYEIPESWEWVRLRNIGSITSGGTPKSSETSFYGGDIIWITPADMGKQQNNKFFATSSKKITQLGLQKSSAQLISKNSVVYSSRAPIGHINIVTEDYTTNQGCKSITPLLVDLNFLYWLLQFRTKDIILRSSGTTFKEISASGFGETLIPLPPLAEQKRIVAKIERALKKVEVYAESYNKLQELDKTFPEKLKKSILQYAMQGKLVAQSPGDEPVEVLLEKIKAEKQKLFEAGKLKKKDLAEMVVEKGDDNSPYQDVLYEIPKSWKWVRLGCVASLSFFPNISGDKIPNCSWVLDMEDIEKETGRLLRKNYKTEKSSYKSNKVSFSQNAVLYAKLRPNLKKVIVADEDGFATTELIPIKLFGNTSPEYIKHCMVSPFYYFNIIQSVYGVKMPRVNSTFLSTTLIPLPPLAEQKRIVAQIEQVFSVIETLV
ncbi:restriction endonuclease subunit S [Streptococcus equi]|uniref:restriction endonuclease subunit S n=1 Tax=Streptococcus equi TaxID=1336 RepID=UPI0005BE47FB|nr:restriction endonuclease subunit S [Streptococcus equi]MCD3438370.1 restriction endonuclease subunit S [Streptococcus equi subsp. zooepidemicus]HEL1058610.1 restriction endonuclease subunit S [Streptococcus equi subsp. zooepidemicus]HEL1285311.1 restriction endonuclease subunit S [Streptococcus equi subsp. zooepidemicus]